MKKFITAFHDLDERRQGLDFEIHEMLDDLDTEKTFENINPYTAKLE